MENKIYVDPDNARREDYKKELIDIQRLGIDPFTKEQLLKSGKIILFETPHWLVFHNEHPYDNTEIHLVLVSQEYAEFQWNLSVEAQLDLVELQKRICEEYKIIGGAFIGRFGDTKKTGATVTHYHGHLIMPKNGLKVCAWFGSE